MIETRKRTLRPSISIYTAVVGVAAADLFLVLLLSLTIPFVSSFSLIQQPSRTSSATLQRWQCSPALEFQNRRNLTPRGKGIYGNEPGFGSTRRHTQQSISNCKVKHKNSSTTHLMAGTTGATGSGLEDPKSMKIGELKNELESYGMNPKIYLEKSEIIDAVVKARAEGKKPIERPAEKKQTTSATTSNTATGTTSAKGQKASTPEGGFGSNLPRETRLQLEIDNCSRMKIGELKAELKKLGIRTTTFFEKSEFVRALAEARVDGVKAKDDNNEEEVVVADVEVLGADDPRGPQKRESAAKAAESRGGGSRAGSSPFGGASPFGGGGMGGIGLEDLLGGMGGMGGGARASPGGGGASPFGGGMGGIEDLLKNMGGGAGGASPFGGAGAGGAGMPDMAKVQQMMSNPKVRSIMAKAQSNPRIMKAMQECMSNPAAMAKYQNDPELKKLLDELKPFL